LIFSFSTPIFSFWLSPRHTTATLSHHLGNPHFSALWHRFVAAATAAPAVSGGSGDSLAGEEGKLAATDLAWREGGPRAATAAFERERVTQEEEAGARRMRRRLGHRRARRPL
jgi:hypothetical protein